MAPSEMPDDEGAAIDAVFQELPAAPFKLAPPPDKPEVPVLPIAPEEILPRKSPPQDYLRELQQEFEEQEGEGKL